jgi:outer membrane protein assembly factor BamB
VLLCVVGLVAACSSNKKNSQTAPTSDSPTSSSSAPSTSSRSSSSSSSSSSGSGTVGAAWLTWGGDATRSNVTSDGPDANGLRKIWTSAALDGDVYGEPLVVGNTVIVATSGDSVYAFDAATGKTKWQQLALGPPVDGTTLPCGNVNPVGITSTPVADPASNRLYVVGMMQPNQHQLIALDLNTGAVLFRTRVDASGADPNVHNQRGALAFADGRVYIPYGGRYGDCGDYKGRIVSVAADGTGAHDEYAVRADRQGGFWGPTGPVVAPDGSLFVASGNSDSRRAFDDGNAVIHLSPTLQATDEFAPSDWAQLNANDADLGTVMPALLDNNRIFQVGKTGVGYVLNSTRLGGVGGELHQEQVCDTVFGGLAHQGMSVIVPCSNRLRSLTIGDSSFNDNWSVNFSSPGPPIIANGLVWVLDVSSGQLHALDSTNGNDVFHADVGKVTHFSAPSAGDRTVFVEGGKTVQAFASSTSGTPVP